MRNCVKIREIPGNPEKPRDNMSYPQKRSKTLTAILRIRKFVWTIWGL